MSIFDAMATNTILQIVVFSVFFGVAMTAIGEKAAPLQKGIDALVDVMLVLTGYVMRFAPIAVFGAIVLGGVGGAAAQLSPEALKLGTVDRGTMVVLFRYVFGAASLGFALAWLSLARMQELPLRGRAVEAAKAIGGE